MIARPLPSGALPLEAAVQPFPPHSGSGRKTAAPVHIDRTRVRKSGAKVSGSWPHGWSGSAVRCLASRYVGRIDLRPIATREAERASTSRGACGRDPTVEGRFTCPPPGPGRPIGSGGRGLSSRSPHHAERPDGLGLSRVFRRPRKTVRAPLSVQVTRNRRSFRPREAPAQRSRNRRRDARPYAYGEKMSTTKASASMRSPPGSVYPTNDHPVPST